MNRIGIIGVGEIGRAIVMSLRHGGVRRQDRHDALAGVRVDDDRIVVNVMAGVGNDELRQSLATGAPLVTTNASAPPGSTRPTPRP
ncbi:hypothetical protein [Streptomyces noursei]|uniref:hypothetical protein n=1 Tax=Streptomyces noursei TaxID=1971 RepID=UPI00382556C3